MQVEDGHDGDEVIELDAGSSATPDDTEDRGDELTPEQAAQDEGSQSDASADENDASEAEEQKRSGIPKTRFNEVNEQRKEALRLAQLERDRAEALAKQLEQLQSQQQPKTDSQEFDEDAKEKAYADALMSGNTALASTIRREITNQLRQELTSEAHRLASQEVETRTVQTLMVEAAQQAMTQFPYLNTPEGADALELIAAARDAAVAKGVPAPKALRDAVAKVAPRFAPAVEQTDAAPTDARTKRAIERGATDSLAQPAVMQVGTGNRASAQHIDVEKLSDKQFADLSIEEKKRLRGD